MQQEATRRHGHRGGYGGGYPSSSSFGHGGSGSFGFATPFGFVVMEGPPPGMGGPFGGGSHYGSRGRGGGRRPHQPGPPQRPSYGRQQEQYRWAEPTPTSESEGSSDWETASDEDEEGKQRFQTTVKNDINMRVSATEVGWTQNRPQRSIPAVFESLERSAFLRPPPLLCPSLELLTLPPLLLFSSLALALPCLPDDDYERHQERMFMRMKAEERLAEQERVRAAREAAAREERFMRRQAVTCWGCVFSCLLARLWMWQQNAKQACWHCVFSWRPASWRPAPIGCGSSGPVR